MLKVAIPFVPSPNTVCVPLISIGPKSMLGFVHPPIDGNGDPLRSHTISHRSPNDVKPENGRELYGEKSTYHLQHKATATYRLDKQLKSFVYKDNSGRYRSYNVSMKISWTDRYRRSGWKDLFYRDGNDLVYVSIYGTHSMITNRIIFNAVHATRFTIISKPYPHKSLGRFTIDYSREKSEFKAVGGSFTLGETESSQFLEETTLEGILSIVQQYGDLEVASTSGTGQAMALYLTFAGSTTPSTALASTAIRTINHTLTSPKLLAYSNEMKDYGTLTAEAAATADSNAANMIAFVRDLKDIKSLIPKLKNLKSLKTHANNYLAVNYGILPTVGDLESIHNALMKTHWTDSFGNQVLTSGHTVKQTHGSIRLTTIRRMKLIVSNDDSEFSQMVRKMRSSGFYPSPQNLWDLIPYSFVLDWFVDIGSFLERIDHGMRIAQLPIVATTYSQKSIYDMSTILEELLPDFAVTAEVISYSRNVASDPIKPPLAFNSELTAHQHLVEGGALILTRSRK